MKTLECIYTRKSVRKYKDKEISDDVIHELLKAAMSVPSCTNARDWSFIVVKDKETLNKMADANGAPAKPLKGASLGILVCGDLDKAFKGAKDYWIIDASICCTNISLAAHELGLGCVWLGTWPQKERVEAQRELFNLPEHIIPHSIMALGYPLDNEVFKERDLYDESCVHKEKW